MKKINRHSAERDFKAVAVFPSKRGFLVKATQKGENRWFKIGDPWDDEISAIEDAKKTAEFLNLPFLKNFHI